MTLNANSAGLLAGKFTIPAAVPAGSKRVEFVGAGGSRGEAVFIGQGELQTDTRQQITRITTTLWWQNTDPLAQTFTLNADTQVGGVDLWFTAKGTSPVVVQVRETTAGVPNKTVLAETRLQPASIALSGHTRIQFPAPVQLLSGSEYALVVLCDDADTALAIAELGKWDNTAGRWVTSQPYQVGVLLSSSNASTWTSHQDRDLRFELLAADYGAAGVTQQIDLGAAAVADATDLLIAAYANQPSADAECVFTLTLDDSSTYSVASGQVVELSERYSGNVAVTVALSGKRRLGAVLDPSVQLMAASVQTTGDYITPTVNADASSDLRVIYDAYLPAGSGVQVHVQAAGEETWTLVPFLSSSSATAGVLELTHSLDAIAAPDGLRVRLTLSGTHTARPYVTNLRVVVL